MPQAKDENNSESTKMIDFTIPHETQDICDNLFRFIDQEVLPLEDANQELLGNPVKMFQEDRHYVPELLALRKQVRMESAKAGFYTMFGAEELGGMGLGPLESAHISEALNERYGPGRSLIQTVVIPSPFTNGLSPVLRALQPELIDHYLPDIASGEKTLCFGLSEPDAGSDVFNLKTTAVKEGDEWVINGTKQWITNAPYADYCMLFAITDKELVEQRKGGITGFFVDTKLPGFDVTSVIPVMGYVGGDTGIIQIENLRVPDSHILGDVHKGLRVAMTGVNTGRIGMSASCVGQARWALRQAVNYANQRKTFGTTIGNHQAVQLMLADCAMDIYAGRNMVLNCAWKLSQGMPALKEISMNKAFNTEMVGRVMDRVIQIHGGMGLTNELKIEEGYRWARLLRIPDGTSEIQRRTIALSLLKEDLDF